MSYISGNSVWGKGGFDYASVRLAHRRVVALFAYEGIDETVIRLYKHFKVRSNNVRDYTFTAIDKDDNEVTVFDTDAAGYYAMVEFILECGIGVTEYCDYLQPSEVHEHKPHAQQPIIAEWLTDARR